MIASTSTPAPNPYRGQTIPLSQASLRIDWFGEGPEGLRLRLPLPLPLPGLEPEVGDLETDEGAR